MDITEEVEKLVGQPENDRLAYKAVLPPSQSMAQTIAAFANTDGGYLILGVADANGRLVINGLSADFQANGITHKALDLLSPRPNVYYQYVSHKGKQLYVVKVEPSSAQILIEDKVFIRRSGRSMLKDPPAQKHKKNGYPKIKHFSEQLDFCRQLSTGSKAKFIDHYQNALNIVDDLASILYPNAPSVPTNNQQGRVLMRILFSSCADNFETYLSGVLYEIYLAKPATLKSDQQVTIKEVLDCADMQEFIQFWSKKKLNKLQRGSVRGFLADNHQIRELQIVDTKKQEDIEKILQIRHLYSHQNGIVDERFLQFFPGKYRVNELHELSIEQMLEKLQFLLEVVDSIDKAAIQKYSLATVG